jgi:hypothetical protein
MNEVPDLKVGLKNETQHLHNRSGNVLGFAGFNPTYDLLDLDRDEDANLFDPIGNILILGDEGIIEEKYTYLDAFLEAFVAGIESSSTENIIKVDPLVEPDDIIFKFKDNTIKLSYGTQSTTILDKTQFVEELKNTVTNFLQELDEFAGASSQPIRKLTKLRRYVVEG